MSYAEFSSLRDIIPPADGRGIFVGQTGCGKTTLARAVLAFYRNVAVLDPKGLIRWQGYRHFTKLKDAMAENPARFIYSPRAEELRDERFAEAFFKWIYSRRNTMAYVDEVYAVTERDEMPDHYHAILTRGRERGIGLLSSSQRPMRIPQAIMSESERWYIFRLNMPGDRKKVEQTVGITSEEIVALPKRHFIHCIADRDLRSGPLTLKIHTPGQIGERNG